MKKQIERLINFWNSPYGPICSISLVLALLDTFLLDITFVTFLLLLLCAAPWLLNFLEEMELPGGFKLKLKDLKEYTEKAKAAGLFKNSDNQYSQATYFKIYGEDPNLALAGLRIEIEKRLLELADAAQIHSGSQQRFHVSIGRLREDLHERGLLTSSESSLLADLIPTLNQAVHGKSVTKDASDWVINDGGKILAALDDKINTLKKKS